jgi:hypothetical protein
MAFLELSKEKFSDFIWGILNLLEPKEYSDFSDHTIETSPFCWEKVAIETNTKIKNLTFIGFL